jgi:type IV pilus assembly protein PilP
MWQRDQQPKKRNSRRFAGTAMLFAGAMIALLGCPESQKAPTKPVPQPVQKQPIVSAPTRTEAATVEAKFAPIYTYNPAGRRDPFAPIIVRESKKGKEGDRPPLERYNLSEFKLTGIIWGGFGYNAMLEGPDGKGYFVRVGTIVGPNRGVVKKITQNTMVIEEKYKTYTGETERKEIVVELRRKQEETP